MDRDTSTFVTKRLVTALSALKPPQVLGISSGPRARARQLEAKKLLREARVPQRGNSRVHRPTLPCAPSDSPASKGMTGCGNSDGGGDYGKGIAVQPRKAKRERFNSSKQTSRSSASAGKGTDAPSRRPPKEQGGQKGGDSSGGSTSKHRYPLQCPSPLVAFVSADKVSVGQGASADQCPAAHVTRRAAQGAFRSMLFDYLNVEMFSLEQSLVQALTGESWTLG